MQYDGIRILLFDKLVTPQHVVSVPKEVILQPSLQTGDFPSNVAELYQIYCVSFCWKLASLTMREVGSHFRYRSFG